MNPNTMAKSACPARAPPLQRCALPFASNGTTDMSGVKFNRHQNEKQLWLITEEEDLNLVAAVAAQKESAAIAYRAAV